MVKVKTVVKDLPFEVIFDDPATSDEVQFESDDCGDTIFNKCKIYINNTLNNNLIKRTIQHELTHAYIWAYGLTGIKWQEELVCNFIETHSMQILKDAEDIYQMYILGGKDE